MKEYIIVIPIYKETLSVWEQFALSKIKSKEEIVEVAFISPSELNVEWYGKFYAKIPVFPFKQWNGTVASYNKLMLSDDFYALFEQYRYILLYQTDAILLKPMSYIKEFIELGYDYIGAPWLNYEYEGGMEIPRYIIPKWKRNKFIYRFCNVRHCMVGNGGLSLRKVSAMRSLIKRHKLQISFWSGNEDCFIAYYGNTSDKEISIAPVEIAKMFSLETEIVREVSCGVHPFGLHGWEKNAKEFVVENLLGVNLKDEM